MSLSNEPLPPNVHVSQHPCLRAKLSLLRSKNTRARDVKSLINEISTIVSVEAFAVALTATDGPKDETPIGFEYTTTAIGPKTLSLVPILRSGLGMVECTFVLAALSSYIPTMIHSPFFWSGYTTVCPTVILTAGPP